MKFNSIIIFCELIFFVKKNLAISDQLCVQELIEDGFATLDHLEISQNISNPEACLDLCNVNYFKGCAITQGSICVCHNVEETVFMEVNITLCNLNCTESQLICGSNDGLYAYYTSNNTLISTYENIHIEAELIPNDNSFDLNITIENADILPPGYFLTLQSGIDGHRFKIMSNNISIEDWSVYRFSFGVDKFLSVAVHDSDDLVQYHSEVEILYSGEVITTELVCPILIEITGTEMFCRLLYINDIYSNYELEIEGTNDDGSETTTQSFYLSNPSCSNLGKTPPLNLLFSASTNYYFISATNPIILRHLGPTTSRKRFISIIGLFGPNSPNKLNLNVYNTECVLLSQSGKCLSDGLYKPPTIQTLEYSVNISTCDTNIYNIITHQCRETCNSLSCSSLEGLDYPEEFHLKDTYELVLNDNDTIKPTAQTLMYISEIEIILEEGDYLGIEGIIQIAFLETQEPVSYSLQNNKDLEKELLLQASVCDLHFIDIPINCEDTTWFDITVKSLNTSSVLENARIFCQDAIKDVNITIVGDSTIQEEDWVENNDYHFRIDEEIEITIDRLNGTNINYTVIWDDGSSNDTDTGDDDVLFKKFTKIYSNNGTYKVQIFMENMHSNDSISDAINQYIHNYTYIFNIYYPVEKWSLQEVFNWFNLDGDYCFEWKSDPNTHLPSKATIKCFWGDEAITSTEEANFEDSIYFGKMGSISYCANHTFESGGTYDLNCTMENKVSEQNLTIENVTIYVPIEGFESFLFFVPKFGDGKLIPGYGEMKSVIPHGRNITFKFSIEKGVIETLQFVNISSNETIGSWEVTDNDIMTFTKEISFRDVGVFSIQIIGSNVLTEAQFNLTFEIVKEIRLMSIKDDGSSTGPTETKAFEIGFDTFGSGVCIEISFGDNIIEAYGDADFCKGFVSKKSVPINNKDITNPFKIEHVYYSMGSYDVTARASNPATIEDLNVEMKNVLILNFDCKVPKVSLNLETLEPTNPFEFFKKEQVKLSAKILVNCYEVVKTQ
ncbi:uncharacterized protein [Lepeophtheirus salmonis]|uniref:uncharacterized protein n=1 Tax=Lepeophtheirus salmonis TaxID=72036 RepID=UPI003AF3CE79